MSKLSVNYGYIPDTPDARDARMSERFGAVRLPASKSLDGYIVKILDQGSTSKCVVHAWAQAMRMCDWKSGLSNLELSSRDFWYYNCLAFDGGGFADMGTQLRSAARAAVKFGRAPESVWPFTEEPLVRQPPWEAYRRAYDYKGPAGYYRVSSLDEIRSAIALGKPVVGGAMVGQSLEDYVGGLYDPQPNERKIGGHAMTVVGYDPGSFTICNSWGHGWGDNGLVHVSPSFMETFTDLWAVHT